MTFILTAVIVLLLVGIVAVLLSERGKRRREDEVLDAAADTAEFLQSFEAKPKVADVMRPHKPNRAERRRKS